MKEILSKLLFVLAIVGIIAAGNLLFPNAENDKLNVSVKPSAESAESPAEAEPEPEAEEYAEPEPEPEENLE